MERATPKNESHEESHLYHDKVKNDYIYSKNMVSSACEPKD